MLNHFLPLSAPQGGGAVDFAIDEVQLAPFVAFLVPLVVGAVADAVLDADLRFHLSGGEPDFPNTVGFAGGVDFFAQGLLAGVVVDDPGAIAFAVLEAAFGDDGTVRVVDFPTAVGLAVLVGGGAVFLAVVVPIAPGADLTAVLVLTFGKLLSVGIKLAVEAVGDEPIVRIAGDLPLVANLAIGILVAVDALLDQRCRRRRLRLIEEDWRR